MDKKYALESPISHPQSALKTLRQPRCNQLVNTAQQQHHVSTTAYILKISKSRLGLAAEVPPLLRATLRSKSSIDCSLEGIVHVH